MCKKLCTLGWVPGAKIMPPGHLHAAVGGKIFALVGKYFHFPPSLSPSVYTCSALYHDHRSLDPLSHDPLSHGHLFLGPLSNSYHSRDPLSLSHITIVSQYFCSRDPNSIDPLHHGYLFLGILSPRQSLPHTSLSWPSLPLPPPSLFATSV